jgi:hypothetical protein
MGERNSGSGTVPLTIVATLVAAAVVVCTASVGALSTEANPGSTCHVPLLEGLTFKLARVFAGRAGCGIRVKGNPVTLARIQTVARQSPAAGAVTSTVTVWLNRACRKGGGDVPEIHEPDITVGPTKLVSGFYVVGGPAPHYFSAPKCPRHPEPPPGAGTVEVVDASGAVVATQTSVTGRFAEITLPAGSYTIRGTFLNATVNGVHPARSKSVTIPSGHTVRQDFFLAVPRPRRSS